MATICVLAALTGSTAWASPASAAATVSVLGSVTTPATYSVGQLAALPQTTQTIAGATYEGVLLLSLVNSASPVYPSPPPSNAILRVSVTVTSGGGGANAGPVTLGAGELHANFGNNQALLALTRDGVPLAAPRLVLPRDTSTARFVDAVSQINVVTRNALHTTPPAGGLTIRRGAATTTLTAAQLAALPSTTRNVTFLSGSSTTANTETGPLLADVLAAAGITPDANTYVAAVATDDYVAIATPAEATAGDRPLMIALQETVTATGAPTTNPPRLVTDGDVRGGRYVSNVTDLVVGQGAPAPPGVGTGAASAITKSGATLAGTVDPHGIDAVYAFEYGTSLSFGSLTSPDGAGAGGGDVPIGATLSGLAPNTTYYYRAVATSAAGTTTGALRSFRTAGTPQAPTAVTLPATAVGTTTATLAGQVNPNGRQTASTFEYGTSTSFGAISDVVALDDADAPEPVSAALTGLAPGTTYLYRVVAINAAGTSNGVVRSFTTSPDGPGGPPIVATGDARDISATGATLSATVDSHGAQTAFAFEYGTTTAFGSLSAIDSAGATNGSQSVALPIAGLTAGTDYLYRVVATNANGTTTGAVRRFTAATPATAFQLNPAHTGVVGDAVAANPTRRWSVNLPGPISYPLIVDGRVFVTVAVGSSTRLYALDRDTGSVLWGPIALGGGRPWSGIASDRGSVFALNNSGLLQAYRAATGAPLWFTQLPGQFSFDSAPTARDGFVYTAGAGSGGTFYVVDGATGAVTATAPVSYGDQSSPAVSSTGV